MVAYDTPDGIRWSENGFVSDPRLVLRICSSRNSREGSNIVVIFHRLARAGETLVIPIKLTDEPRLDWMLIATVVPTLALVSSEVLLLRSARNRMCVNIFPIFVSFRSCAWTAVSQMIITCEAITRRRGTM